MSTNQGAAAQKNVTSGAPTREFNANDPGSRDEAYERYVSERHAIREINDAALAGGEPVGEWMTSTPYTYHTFSHAFDTRIGRQTSATPEQFIALLEKKEALPLPVNRGLSHSDDPSLLRKRKDGKVFMPVTFCDAHGGRKNGNVSKMHNLVVDIDNDPAFLQGRPQITERDIKRALVELGLAGKIITSFNSTPDQPKFRVILWLRAPYLVRASLDDADGAKSEALWEYAYDLIAKCFTPDYDKKCKNVARIWYWPADDVERDETQKYVISEFVPGAVLDIHALLAARPLPVRAPKKQPNDEPRSPKRVMFNHLYGAMKGQFSQGDAMLDLYGLQADEKEHDGANGVVSSCPKRFDHSSELGNPDESKKPLISFNADVAKHGRATSSCFHNSCEGRSAADFLFAAIEECRPEILDSAKALWNFLQQHVSETHEDALASALATWAPDDDEIDAAFDEIEAAEGDQQKALARAFLKRVAALPDGVDTLTLLERLQPFLGMPLTAAKKALNDERKVIKKARAFLAGSGRGDGVASGHAVPEDPAQATIIWASWDYYDKIACARARFCAVNNKEPSVFRRTEGGIVRLQNVGDAMLFEPVNNRHQWVHELAKRMKFCVDTDDTEADAEEPFVTVLTEFMGANDLPLPVVERIVEVPVFGEDGTLRTEKGYDAASKVYLNPKIEFCEVPDVVTDKHIEEALWWLREDTRDFPFSDAFDGDEKHPVRLKNEDGSWADVDADGFPLPNPERGAASAVNFMAMRLQPFVREMIGGACPAYYIDKPGPGTGAGYLMNAYSYTLTAEAAEPQTVPDNDDEFRKDFASVLMGGAHTVFYDNLHGKMDSRHAASIITAEKIKPRILGRSANIVVKVKATIVFAGNNGKFSPEMMRRIVPIRLDADLVNPAMDRGPDWYKHDLDEWCPKNHANTVWACHVLVRNWLQKGKPAPSNLKGSHFGNTFGSYVRTIGGILEAAGVAGFLGNGRAFMDARADQANPYIEVAERLFEKCPDKFGTSDVIDALKNPMTGDVEAPEGISIDTRDDKALRDSVGVMLATMASNVYDTLPGKEGVKMKLVKKKSNGVMKYTWLVAA